MRPHNLLLPILALATLAACSHAKPTANQDSATVVADHLVAQGNDVGAASIYAHALEENPKDVAAHRGLAALYELHGNYAEAESHYAAAVKIAPDDAEALRGDARSLLHLGRAVEARDAYQKVLENDRHDVKALNGIGITEDFLGQYDAAAGHFQKALDEDKGNLTTLSNFGHSYVLAGQYDKAITLLEPHARDKAAPPALRQNLAEAYGMTGKLPDAERLSRMDLKADEVKRNMAYYKSRRAKLAPAPTFVADLGSYPTSALAEVWQQRVREALNGEFAFATIAVTPEVKAIGGTPSFAISATGFANAAQLDAFCAKVRSSDLLCRASRGSP